MIAFLAFLGFLVILTISALWFADRIIEAEINPRKK